MKDLCKYLKVSLLLMVCTLFLGAGIKAEAATLPKVEGLKQISAGQQSLTMKWDAVVGNDIGYKLQICADNRFVSGVKEQIERYNTEEYIAELSSGKTYYVRIAAYYKSDETALGPWTEPIQVVTKPGSNKNANLCQTASGATSISMKWNRNPEANAYILEYFKSGALNNKLRIPLGNVTSYTLTNLQKDSEYSFFLYPVNVCPDFRAESGSFDDSDHNCPTLPSKLSGCKAWYYSPTMNYFELAWNSRPSADGYQYEVWSMTGKNGKKLVTNKAGKYSTSTSFVNTKLKKSQFVKARMRAYVELSDGSTKYGPWSNWSYTSRQPDLEIKNVRGGQRLTWNKVDGAKNYTIWVSTRAKTGFKKVKTTTKRSLTVKKCGKSALKSGRTYHYTIVANKKIGKKTYQGSKTHSFSLVYYKR